MSLAIFNSMTRKKEPFRSIEPGIVKMYVCGPTVYNYIHIGNARPAIVFDVVKRYLTSIGYDVTYVVNFTDVDDKLIRKAEELGMTVPEVADRFIQAFLEDTKGLRVEGAIHPRVTDNIPEIIAFIEGLIDKSYAYESKGDVYFRTQKFADYGKLANKNLDELQFGIRIEVDERKENPEDFVLWKAAKPGEIAWASPWGEGRPGWHIECSAMAKKYLGVTIDIHGGGQDLEFPHHECEVAQSEALSEHALAHYWMHNGYLNINNEKMSKSLGNGLNVRDLLKQYKAEAIRFFMLSAHYRGPLNFSDEAVRAAENSLDRLNNCIAALRHRLQGATSDGIDPAIQHAIEQAKTTFELKMNDDFNTADAITVMFDLVAEANRYLLNEHVSSISIQALLKQFQAMDFVLAILEVESSQLLDGDVERLIEERVEARRSKNWKRADEIRDLLTERGILLEDTPQGIRWRRK